MALQAVGTDWVPWFREQLRTSGEAFVWAITQIDARQHHVLPPKSRSYLGDWPPVRHIWHVAYYEQCLVLPKMRELAGGPRLPDEPCPDWDNWDDFASRTVGEHVADFRAARADLIAQLDDMADADWTTPRETGWGYYPLSMVHTKTLQHTFEHANTLLLMALWWPLEEVDA